MAAAPPSAALAALVAEAGEGSAADDTAEVPVVEEVSEDPGAEPVSGSEVVVGAEPVVVAAADVDGEGVDAADPLFDELVSAYGVDPVHDPLLGEQSPTDAGSGVDDSPHADDAAEHPAHPGPATTGD